ncbi:AbrB/MazE/SpoVT family DNA-binding domain-containing protein [Patulibacter brassicae]|uniref:AbrB/MazE/SpoVT family DNA-binding domain-containing protein n=1 Tax=Patulibacter brassicae TaxID=1705717 RepID=A0ABU4VQH5_9ACTN|nr:AbrB/MazE/SpoVT family DNA-binding domain-containing protein [Patulibacter brassicae]MDX8153617.1 AbrB/MazE/SpoVT family DNA-binding domain-containing protein [Patulibacter brassicae]
MRDAQATVVRADGRGRILLPQELRDRLGIQPHSVVAVELQDDGSVVLRDRDADRRRRVRAVRGSFRGAGESVDDLLAARRADARAEADDA